MKAILKLVVAILFISSSSQAQLTWRVVPWYEDKWDSKSGMVLESDKLEHLLVASGMTFLGKVTFNDYNWEYTLALGVLYEVKDALVPYEDYGRFGGEGFSFKDVVADLAGALVGDILGDLANRVFRKKRESGIQVSVNFFIAR